MSCNVYAQAENGRRVQTDERERPALSIGVCVPPPVSPRLHAHPRATPGMTYDLPYCRGTHTQAARLRANRASFVYMYERKSAPPRTPADAGRRCLWRGQRGRVNVCHIARFARLHNISGLPAGCYFSRRRSRLQIARGGLIKKRIKRTV